MTIINYGARMQPPLAGRPRPRHRSTRIPVAGTVSMEVSWLAANVNALFAVGLDLAATRSDAHNDTAVRLDRAIDEIDTIISTLRMAVIPPARVGDRTSDEFSHTPHVDSDERDPTHRP